MYNALNEKQATNWFSSTLQQVLMTARDQRLTVILLIHDTKTECKKLYHEN
jgi:hypothetical protein